MLAVMHYMNPAFEPYIFVFVILLCILGAVMGGYFIMAGLLHLLRGDDR